MSTVAAVLAVYDQVDPVHLREALAALLSQERPPDEVILVADGPLTRELETEVAVAATRLQMRRVDLPTRSGSGPAKQAGLEAASAQFVAIVDADDVSLPARLRVQLEAMAELNCDVLGTSMEEVDAESGAVLGQRDMPVGSDAIARMIIRANPINHPTVLLRRQTVVDAGGYNDLPMLEDYDLWARLHSTGAKIENLDAVLVRFRGGQSAQRRRRSREAFASEWRMQRNLRRYGLISPFRMVSNWMLRSTYRVLPIRISMAVYRRLYLHRTSERMIAGRPEYDRHIDMSEVRGPLGETLATQILRTSGISDVQAASLDVLDVGSGYGDTGRALAKRCRHVTCLEPASELHERAQAKAATESADNMSFILGRVEDFEAENAYDLVILDNVYEHLPAQVEALDTLWRALRPGGRLFLLTPNRLWPIEAHYHLPGLAWLPLPVANAYLRASRRGRDYTDASYAPTYWRLRKVLNAQDGWDYAFVLPGDPSATVAGQPWHYRAGMAAIRRHPSLWTISKALLVVATKRPNDA